MIIDKGVFSLFIAILAASLAFTNVSAAVENPVGITTPSVSFTTNTSNLTDAQLKAAASVLGISVDLLKMDLDEGMTLEDLADNAGVDVRQVYSAIRRARWQSGSSGTSTSTYYGYTVKQLKNIAAYLDISLDTLKGDLAEGLTLQDLADNAGINVQVLYDVMNGKIPGNTPQSNGGMPPNNGNNPPPGGGMPPR